ncbi:MAG: hypothetical protein DYG86_09525 [Chloroflexi bacterium CFX2]|nr:hypothetical protein [Chloroflexi bacterium CFX2]
MFPHSYALEKLTTSVRILATSKGDVRSRLWDAYLEFHPLQINDFPLSLQADYEGIIIELTKRKPKDEWELIEWERNGSVKTNLRRMKNLTGSKIANKICDLQFRIQLLYDEWRNNL